LYAAGTDSWFAARSAPAEVLDDRVRDSCRIDGVLAALKLLSEPGDFLIVLVFHDWPLNRLTAIKPK
jgi:hypothetical protein